MGDTEGKIDSEGWRSSGPEAWSRYAVEEAHRLPEDWRLPIDDRTKKQVPSFMSLLKPPPSPVKIAANQRSRPGFGIRRSGFEKKEGTGLAEGVGARARGYGTRRA